ncbi:condensation domain-containing protein, partial [Nocardia gipuzkoensis]
LITRHETLRTTFTEIDGTPFQHIHHPHEIHQPVSLVDLTTDPDDLDTVLSTETRHAFDLATEVPLRASIVRTGPYNHTLILLLHHIAGDGWSMQPLFTDLAAAYTARRHNTAPDWTSLPVQYADYTLWQHEILGSDTDPASLISQQLEYWRAELAGLPDQLTLPTDRPRPKTATYRGDIATFTISPATRAAITQLAQRQNATPSMVLGTVG